MSAGQDEGGAGATAALVALVGFATYFVIRACSNDGWSLPVYRAREWRTAEEVKRLRK
jgi:hypothetical protein